MGHNEDLMCTFEQANQNCRLVCNSYVKARNDLLQQQTRFSQLQKELQGLQSILTMEVDSSFGSELQTLQTNVVALDSNIRKLEEHLFTLLESTTVIMQRVIHTLVADNLVIWLIKQKELTCGPRSVQQEHYQKLDEIEIQFEKCGVEIVAMMTTLGSLISLLNSENPLLPRLLKCKADVVQNVRQFIWQSLVISIQPPAVLVKCRGSDSHRSTRFPCRTEVRLLGGEAIGARKHPSQVKVDLISEETAKKIQRNPAQPAVTDPTFHLIYNDSAFQVGTAEGLNTNYPYRACFEKIRLVESIQKRTAADAGFDEKKGTRRSKVSSLRYYLAFHLHIGPFLESFLGPSEMVTVNGYKLSLPVAALVHSSLEAEASLFWNRFFAEGTGILSHVPETVTWESAKKALGMKWGALIQEPQDVRDLNVDLPEPVSLSPQNLEHLGRRLEVEDGLLCRKNFFNKTISHKENKDGSPLPCVFFEWFYKCANVVNKYMYEQWQDGLIEGFCSKEQSENALNSVMSPTMLIRFSDMRIGFLKISCKLPGNQIVHYETEADKMPVGTTIADAIYSNPTFSYIKNIYPNRDVSMLWQNRNKRNNDEKMHAGWNSAMPPGYFDTVYQLESKPVAALLD
ncbi:unnamed protein product [Bursaphelenchus xylophilus]|uniref:(pine wood nematode) hypothetical protein n=1 Tax=Bursaphelenchus xylophilus TaxID=6326 RepID=A0A1I7STM5_BURXY|nr:unnamed protein product [Bursaphelenchus xylophilus]CAG9108216.1 unnamed protein product [Bursaphelenchus xylophilus]